MADCAGQANEMAQSLLYFEGLLRELTASAKTRLLLVPNTPSVSVYHHTDYLDPAKAPADLALSPRYDIELSTRHPVVKWHHGVQESLEIQREQSLLVSLEPVFQGVFAQSVSEDLMEFEDLDLAIRETGTPMVWTYVALETGIHVAYPEKVHIAKSMIQSASLVPRQFDAHQPNLFASV